MIIVIKDRPLSTEPRVPARIENLAADEVRFAFWVVHEIFR
jgi:hypothetical protein